MNFKELISRNECVYSGMKDLEHLHTFEKFPIFMGCTSNDVKDDIFTDMRWEISKSSGSIQLNPLIPLNILYQFSHNEAIGRIWEDHHNAFSDFLNDYSPSKILEIGGNNGILAKKFIQRSYNIEWTILDPNANIENIENIENIRIINGFIDELFDDNSTHKFHNEEFDMVIHTHTFEHLYSPAKFLKNISKFLLKKNSKMLFSIPNMKKGIESKYTNMLNFEHSFYMDERHVDYIIQKSGFLIIDKKYFNDHSIFYSTQYQPELKSPILCPDLYIENSSLFHSFVDFYRNEIQILNDKIKQFNGSVYLFGAHVFSQFLIFNGLDTSKISSILDNGPIKIGKRLYGTKFIVESPEILKNKNSSMVILKAGAYNSEIKQQIINKINKNIIFVE